ncbi:MAG TPA: MFS transporter [Pirellulales bacterium]|jgi:MFS family permease|nr:MFS transporter [Pirellulales bacterium]
MPSDTSTGTLQSRSYVGLLVAQFLACFNDQAIHYVAFFYAVDMLVRYVGLRHLDVKLLAVIVTSCFIAPFLLFSPLAGVLADKYSKRTTIVFWKIAEVGIMGLVFAGFLLPHVAGASIATISWSAAMLIGAVFLMGTHSTFFIPAKYGVMPEILHPSVLSRGNGILEGSSFTGNILGTVFGGMVYIKCHSTYDPQSGVLVLGQEWILGLSLLGLALLGAVGALLMPRLPAADPNRKMEWNPWIPVRDNLRVLRRSRPLVLATIGIAFFTFMTLFFRLILIFQGETNKDYLDYQTTYRQTVAAQRADHSGSGSSPSARSGITPLPDWDEELLDELTSGRVSPGDSFADDVSLDDLANGQPSVSAAQPTMANQPIEARNAEFLVAIMIAFIALGVGIGCGTAGMISGDRIELGLVPFGAILIVLFTGLLAYITGTALFPHAAKWITRGILVAVGMGAGLYIVPLYTLLQHRAPKESKGNLVALSNFLNVTGGLVAVGVFYFITFGLQKIFGMNLTADDVAQSPGKLHDFVLQLQQATQIPRMLFLAASLITLAILYLLCRQRPDFLLRTISWFQLPRRRHLHTVGLANVPGEGHVILATNCHETDAWIYVMSAIDRRACYLRPEPPAGAILPGIARLESLARRLGLLVSTPEAASEADWHQLVGAGVDTLVAGYLVAMTLDGPISQHAFAGPISATQAGSADDLYESLQARIPSTVLPVFCDPLWDDPSTHPAGRERALVRIGKPLPPESTTAEIRASIGELGARGEGRRASEQTAELRAR